MELPQLDCGSCGVKTCAEFAKLIASKPDMVDRCIHLGVETIKPTDNTSLADFSKDMLKPPARPSQVWQDALGREFDFILNHFPHEPGPREIILPHNPLVTEKLEIKVGDVLIGRPLGMSCGCPVTHCGVCTAVDYFTGVITWCITGPLRPRAEGYKNLGYYIAEAYEGLVVASRVPLKIGMRYYFQPEMCMLQWRHSGLLNYLSKSDDGTTQIRIEGLFIG